jgi:DNA-directed RNA polymerase subunit RPC12/RpoP
MARNRNVKQFQGGRTTPREYHQAHAFPPYAKCQGCGARPMIRAITMMPWDDFLKADGAKLVVDQLAHKLPELVAQNVVQLKGPDGLPRPHVRLGVAYSCERCQRDFERALAKLPSYVVVDLNRGPSNAKVITSG